MKTVYAETHALRDAKTEVYGGELVYPFERPSRMTYILDRLNTVQLGPILPPDDHGQGPILAIHDKGLVDFLQTAWDEWTAAGYAGEAIPTCWPARRMVQRCPNHIDGKLGYFALATETSLTEGTWPAAYGSAQVALTAADLIRTGERAAFALCRPPGHHAALDMYGGYCFLNNAAIAAQHYLENGANRVAILDVDFHHGNGTQDIFYDRSDVLFLSLHGEPENAFPHFLGYTDETGSGAGAGFTVNYPMPPGTPFAQWRKALADALDKIAQYAPDQLIVSLGVDTFETDPISFFKLKSPDFTTYGADIAALGLPTLFVMEGGYDIDEIGLNTVNVLQGFLGAT
ncbi:histone deacetylase family protein [Marimonas lutisalis]|uniref:histone deacetylase family protein n=1 Tax=Marimonas lutisalis TaxID=2545756 RepID=UPI0010F50A96|nr:histone deacetylase family protein [Marimonas lutisalis]